MMVIVMTSSTRENPALEAVTDERMRDLRCMGRERVERAAGAKGAAGGVAGAMARRRRVKTSCPGHRRTGPSWNLSPSRDRGVSAPKGDNSRGPRRALAALIPFVLLLLTGQAQAQVSLLGLWQTVEAWREAPEGWDRLRLARAQRFVDDMDAALALSPDSEAAWRTVLVAASLGEHGAGGEGIQLVARSGRAAFERLLAAPDSARLRRWALAEVVVGVNGGRGARSRGRWRPSLVERRMCLDLVSRSKVPGLRTALLTVARRPGDPLRNDAFSALAHWADRFGADEAVDLFLVQQLGARFDVTRQPHPVNVVLERLQSGETPLAPRAQALLRERMTIMLLSADWREPARALRLACGIPIEQRVPILLDALSVWDRRANSKKEYSGLVRVQSDLVRELRAVSGRRYGAHPEPWIDWWVRVRQGKEPMPGTLEFERARKERAAESRSTASFFGLRPESDRITFVIDFSGSMGLGWGTTGHTRYEEAIEQMMRFLQGAPPTTRFNVLLFSGTPQLSSPELIPASAENLERARTSLLARHPTGGTNLRPAIRLALKLDASGRPDLEGLEADTVIVLCDGETAEGAGWVKPLMDRVLPMHPVVFHTVHLGVKDDGALRSLAEASGGHFLRVGG